MTTINILWDKWKSRFVLWINEAKIILCMWSIWLIHVYVENGFIMNVLTIFMILVILFEIGTREIQYSKDYSDMEKELNRLKNKN